MTKRKRFGRHPHSRLPRNPLHCQPRKGRWVKVDRMRKARSRNRGRCFACDQLGDFQSELDPGVWRWVCTPCSRILELDEGK